MGPRDIPHRFWNAGDRDGRFLPIISPAGLEPFFEASSRLMAEAPDDLARQAELAGRYGLAFVCSREGPSRRIGDRGSPGPSAYFLVASRDRLVMIPFLDMIPCLVTVSL